MVAATILGASLLTVHAIGQASSKPVNAANKASASVPEFRLMITSLIPSSEAVRHGSEGGAAILTARMNETIHAGPIIGVPVGVRIEHDKVHSSKVQDFYVIQILDKEGNLLKEMNVADDTAATFVDQRIQVHLSVI